MRRHWQLLRVSMQCWLLSRRYALQHTPIEQAQTNCSLLLGDPNLLFQNVFNTSGQCLSTDLSSACINACTSPAYCESTRGQCACEIPELNLIFAVNSSKQTCQCPGHPFVQYNTRVCDSSIGRIYSWWFSRRCLALVVSRSDVVRPFFHYEADNKICDHLLASPFQPHCRGSHKDVE